MKHKYYSTHMKPNKCIRPNFFNPNNEKYEKVLNFGWLLATNPRPTTHPRGNDSTMTNFDGWLDLKPLGVIFKPQNEKYEKVLGWFLAPQPRGNDSTLTNFDGW
jgi:hypothetical protein